MDLTDSQLHTLRHMLGINTPGDREPKPYRNYAAVDPADKEFIELERLGAISFLGERYGLKYLECTEAGRLAAMRSHKTIRHGRAKRVYLKYLDIADCYCDLTFKEFLTSPEFKQARRYA